MNDIKGQLSSKCPVDHTFLYCTGYPEEQFLSNYQKQYNINTSHDDIILNRKNYSLIKKIGFDAISIWDYRKREGGYKLADNLRVDAWGRIYNDKWYLWDGVFKNESIIENWEHLNLPRESDLGQIKDLLIRLKTIDLYPVFSLPGLFEKTWQSMGFKFFAKCLKKGNFEFLRFVIDYFFNYLKLLISTLTKYGVSTFLIADDLAYKHREFVPKHLLSELFLSKYRDITDLVHKNNQTIILHSDGYITNLIDIIINIGFDAIQSLEPDAGVNLIELFYKYHNKICFIGNISNTKLSFGAPIDIKKYVDSLIYEARKANACLIISPTQQINSIIKPENVNSMIMATKKLKSSDL